MIVVSRPIEDRGKQGNGMNATETITPRILQLPQLLFHPLPFPEIEIPKRMVWTSSAVKLFRRCKRKFFWKYMLRLHPRSSDRHLILGSAFHQCLGQWYRGKRVSMRKIIRGFQTHLDGVIADQGEFFDQDDLDKTQSMADTFAGMMLGYAETYERDRNEWNILRPSIEAKFSVDMGDFDYQGKIDLITQIRSSRQNTLVEHKTASKISSSYVDRLPLDTQIRGYIFGATYGLGLRVNEVMYDVVEKCRLRRKSSESLGEFANRVAEAYTSNPDRYFHREQLQFNCGDIDAFEYELRQTHQEYQAIVDRLLDGIYYETFPPLDPRAWTPNDTECNAFFRTCEYMTLCTSGLDPGTARMYNQGQNMHEELADEPEE